MYWQGTLSTCHVHTGLQDSDYETLIKNKKIELRFVLENNQIIKRLG